MATKAYYPIYVDIVNKKCVVIGGGVVAERKVKTLLRFGGKVKVVSKKCTPDLKKIAKRGAIRLIQRDYKKGDLGSAILAIVATNDSKVNKRVYHEAKNKNIFVNVVDNASLCSFIAPSTIKRGPLVVSISTSGQAPALAKSLRERFEKIIPSRLGKLAEEIGKVRRKKIELKSNWR